VNPLTDAVYRAWRTPRGRAGALALGTLSLLSLVTPPFLPDPAAQPDVLNQASLPPSLAHPFGTDQLSRDVLARVMTGGRVSLSVALIAVLMSITLGAVIGLSSGYWRGALDAVLMRLEDGALAIPRLFLLLLVLSAWDRVPVPMLVLLIGATGWLGTSRLVRGEVLRLREEAYIEAAHALGAPPARVIFRHLLPNTLGPLLVTATLGVGNVILLEAGLSFLGLGIQPPTPSWGGMILDAKSVLVTAPWTGLFPGLAIVLTVLSVNLLGDAMRDAMDPRGV
jgi:peptide/nickel transport system permease protein